jgi:hypothetical protein
MREAYIFDLDDTLIQSNSHIYIYDNKNLLVEKINSHEYVHKRNNVKKYIKDGYHVDTREFGGEGLCQEADHTSLQYLMNGIPLHDQIHILQEKSKYNNIETSLSDQSSKIDIYLVTGRGNKPETLQHLIQTRFQVHIPINHIYPVSNKNSMNSLWYRLHNHENYGIIHLLENGKNAANFKKASLYDILQKKYDKVTFYDDDHDNIDCFNNLVEDLNILGFHIQHQSYLIK